MNQQPPDVPQEAPRDQTGWAQPPANEGPPGAFVNRQPVGSGQPLPPGAGSPVQPGPPMSVQAPIRHTAFNLGALAIVVGVAVVVILVVVVVLVLVGSMAHR